MLHASCNAVPRLLQRQFTLKLSSSLEVMMQFVLTFNLAASYAYNSGADEHGAVVGEFILMSTKSAKSRYNILKFICSHLVWCA